MNEHDTPGALLGELRSKGAKVAEASEALLKTAEARGRRTMVRAPAVRELEKALADYRAEVRSAEAIPLGEEGRRVMARASEFIDGHRTRDAVLAALGPGPMSTAEIARYTGRSRRAVTDILGVLCNVLGVVERLRPGFFARATGERPARGARATRVKPTGRRIVRGAARPTPLHDGDGDDRCPYPVGDDVPGCQ